MVDRIGNSWSTGKEISTIADRKGNFYDGREDREIVGWRIGLKICRLVDRKRIS